MKICGTKFLSMTKFFQTIIKYYICFIYKVINDQDDTCIISVDFDDVVLQKQQ